MPVIEAISKRRKSRAPLSSLLENVRLGDDEVEDAMMDDAEERGVFQFAETVEQEVWSNKISVDAMHVSGHSFN